MALRALARVNVAAVQRNVERLCRELVGGAELCAVVKADGYGHGAAPVAVAALSGGASRLAVATAAEAMQLRDAGIDAPLLVLGALSTQELPVALAARAEVVVWSERFLDEILATPRQPPVRVHIKLDTGMGRLGTRDGRLAAQLAERVLGSAPELELTGAMTHFATADGDAEFLAHQLSLFEPFAAAVRRLAPEAVIHAANSAATLREPRSHFDLVRCGIAMYGLDPMHQDPALRGLDPALELTSYLAAVKPITAGETVGYGRRFVAANDSVIATLPIGYADGIRRAFTNDMDVLVAGRRYQLVGAVSMDNITIDLGPDCHARPGDLATIIGRSGDQTQTAEQLARRIGTINYEIVCGISARVPRDYHRDGEPA